MGLQECTTQKHRRKAFFLSVWVASTEAAFLDPSHLTPFIAEDYRKEVMESLSSARKLAVDSIARAQKRYKEMYDRNAKQVDY